MILLSSKIPILTSVYSLWNILERMRGGREGGRERGRRGGREGERQEGRNREQERREGRDGGGREGLCLLYMVINNIFSGSEVHFHPGIAQERGKS